MSRIVSEYVQPSPGMAILDVGCGYGDMAEHVPGCRYVGVDANAAYISLAERLHGGSGQFVAASVTDLAGSGLGPFDLAVAVGLLHHLSDDDASALLKALPDLLTQRGRFVAAEPVFHPDQRTTARVLAALDRGRHVREQRGYEALVAPWFKDVSSEVRHDLYWFPYSHCVVQATLAA